jgi:hypothetical protein
MAVRAADTVVATAAEQGSSLISACGVLSSLISRMRRSSVLIFTVSLRFS